MSVTVPRTIWILWQQGISDAPLVVRKCIASWRRENPAWDIVLLDAANLHEYIDLQVPEDILAKLSRAHQADLARLALLSKYGGVWADATTYCLQPLDEWIDDSCRSGFFVFSKPSRDRLISNWFMASTPGSPIVTSLYLRMSDYWVRNQFGKLNWLQKACRKISSVILNRNISATRHWFNPIMTKVFRVYPYFVFHYMFANMIATDSESSAIWKRTKKVSTDLPHLIQRAGMFSYPADSIKQQIEDGTAPLFKLRWQYDSDQYGPDTLLYYLLEQRQPKGRNGDTASVDFVTQ